MAKDAKNNKDVKNKKHFFKDFKAELKKVIWPTSKQLVNNTIAVVTIVLITAIIVFILDSIFNVFNEKAVNGLKSKIGNKVVIENVVESENETDENNNEAAENESVEENVQ